jgi:hypothetical protein
VDIVGPLPVPEVGFTYLKMMMDRTTQWVEAVSLKSIAAASCVEAFLHPVRLHVLVCPIPSLQTGASNSLWLLSKILIC